MSFETAIKLENIGKCYQIFNQPHDRLKQFLLPRMQRVVGKHPKQYFSEFWAVKRVSFEIEKGDTVGIIGRNGSGKSTLLQMICGTLSPTSGTIQSYGRIAALLELGSGFNSEFTGRENVYLNGAIFGLDKSKIDQQLDAILAFADIGDFVDQPVKTYSSGMMVRLAFAVIAHVNADILVIDEALAVGDAFFTQKCMRYIRNFQEEGGTLLFVSHDTGAVVNLCNKVILLKEGQIIKVGTPKEVTKQYLQDLYESRQGKSPVSEIKEQQTIKKNMLPPKDFRAALIERTHLRNDIEVFLFSHTAESFGKGGATIINVTIWGEEGSNQNWVTGGSNVKLTINCVVNADLYAPIIGFQFKDKLGQVLFADNTYLAYRDAPITLRAGENISADFYFYLPVLPVGEYAISPAIATGTQQNHIQHHWIHDALIVNVHSSSVPLGLIGLQVSKMELHKS